MKLNKADTLVIKIGFNPNKQLKQLKQHLKNLGLESLNSGLPV